MSSVIRCLDPEGKNPSSQWVSGDGHSLTPPPQLCRANKWLSTPPPHPHPRNSCLPLLLSPHFVPLQLDQVQAFPLRGLHTSSFYFDHFHQFHFLVLARTYCVRKRLDNIGENCALGPRSISASARMVLPAGGGGGFFPSLMDMLFTHWLEKEEDQ